MKNKFDLSNSSYKFADNFYKALIAPIVCFILAIVFACTLGFTKGLDYTGGILISVVAGTETKLDDKETYKSFKSKVDEVLKENDVKGDVYSVEVNNLEEYTMVVKFAFNGTKEQTDSLISSLKSGLINKFYSESSEADIENNNLVIVANFGGCVDTRIVITAILATLIAVILMCIYIFFRMGLNASILSIVSAIFNNLFAISVILIARVQITYASIIVLPFVSVISVLFAFIYLRKAKAILKTTDKYDRLDNKVLANDAVKQTINAQVFVSSIAAGCALIFGLFNICNSVMFVALALFTCIACALYTNLMLLPGLFAKTFIRKVKRNKPVKEKAKENKLTEEQIMKETDLDNLVSN